MKHQLLNALGARNIAGAFNRSQSISETVAKAMNNAPRWNHTRQPFVQSSTRRVELLPVFETPS